MEVGVILGGFFLSAAVVGYGLGVWESKKLQRRLRKLQYLDIAEVSDGWEVVLSATVCTAAKTVVAPISKAECVAYNVFVSEHSEHGKRGHWKKVFTEQQAVDFLVEDASSKALVFGSKLLLSELDPKVSKGGQVTTASKDEALIAFLESNNISTSGRLRYVERRIDVGETLRFAGVGTWRFHESSDYGEGAEKILQLNALLDGILPVLPDQLVR